MKKILLMSLSMVFLCSCSFKEKEVIADPTITVEPASTQNIGEDASERDYRGLIPETSNIKDQIKEKFLFYPTDIIINLDTKNIRWVADCGVGLDLDLFTEQDQEAYVRLHRSIYEGTLTEIAENSYSAKGEFMPSMLSENSPISESVDFYLILKDRKAYIVLEEMSLDDLEEYNSDSYYYWHEKTEK